MFYREAMGAERAVKERIGSRAIRRLLRLTSSTAVILIEGLVLRLMAAAAGSRIHVDRRTIRHLLQVLINARVAGRAGNVLVRGAGVGLGDIGVAGRAGRQISGLSGNACAQRKSAAATAVNIGFVFIRGLLPEHLNALPPQPFNGCLMGFHLGGIFYSCEIVFFLTASLKISDGERSSSIWRTPLNSVITYCNNHLKAIAEFPFTNYRYVRGFLRG